MPAEVNTSTMAPKNGAGTNGTEGSAPPEPAPQTTRRRGRPRKTQTAPPEGATDTSPSGSPASPTSAAAKAGRKKRGGKKKKSSSQVKPPSEADFALVGEVVHIAWGGGKDSLEPAELIEIWRQRIEAWNRVHGVAE